MSGAVLFVGDEPALFERVEELLAGRGIKCVYANTPTTAATALALTSIKAALVDSALTAADELAFQLSSLTDVPVRVVSRSESSDDESLWAVLRPALRVKRAAARF